MLWDSEKCELERGQALQVDLNNDNEHVEVTVQDFAEVVAGEMEPLFGLNGLFTLTDLHRLAHTLTIYCNPRVTAIDVARASRGGRVLTGSPTE